VKPHASVIVPTRNRRETLRACLGCLAEQTVPPGHFEVVVVVDRATDGTVSMLRALETPYRLSVIEVSLGARAPALNVGLRQATGELVVLLDDDMQPDPGLIAAYMRHRDGACVLGPVPVVLRDGDSPVAAHVGRWYGERDARLAAAPEQVRPEDFLSGNVAIPRELLDRIGGFDERFAQYGNEEIELYFRLRDAGAGFRFEAAALARQGYDKSFRQLARDTLEEGGTAVQLVGMHPEALRSTKLDSYHSTGSRPWRAVRRASVVVGARIPGVTAAAVEVVALLERRVPALAARLYAPVLSYIYWVGVFRRMRRNRREGQGLRSVAELASLT
jgi:glycosyltransferase involved in cell wall biosynthesis